MLLGAGADPTLEERHGLTPLHYVTLKGHVELDMVYSRAPAMLNRHSAQEQTPLLLACYGGQDNMVSKLLPLGAMQDAPEGLAEMSPFIIATCEGYEGGEVLVTTLYMTLCFRPTRILPLLLAGDGEENRSEWINKVNQGGISACFTKPLSSAIPPW